MSATFVRSHSTALSIAAGTSDFTPVKSLTYAKHPGAISVSVDQMSSFDTREYMTMEIKGGVKTDMLLGFSVFGFLAHTRRRGNIQLLPQYRFRGRPQHLEDVHHRPMYHHLKPV
jgi:hypothetical protein